MEWLIKLQCSIPGQSSPRMKMLQTLKESYSYSRTHTSCHTVEICLLCHHYITTFLYYNLYIFIERMFVTSDPAPFLEIYYVAVRMCGSAASLDFLPDKQALRSVAKWKI